MSTNYSNIQSQLEVALIETRSLLQESLQIFPVEHLSQLIQGQMNTKSLTKDFSNSFNPSKFKIFDMRQLKASIKHSKYLSSNQEFAEIVEKTLGYLDHLHTRLKDRSSRIMVTGDINSGKSTFINAVIGKEILPVDEQPCTQAFCEISAINCTDGISQDSSLFEEEINVLGFHNFESFQHNSKNAFKKVTIEELHDMFQTDCPFPYFKIYTSKNIQLGKIANNFEISIIDTPGLNFDSIKTTALLASQQQIDVVIFLINSANQLTLSAREFLSVAAVERLHIFIVVSKFDQISQSSRCKERILRQIGDFLPETFVVADDLIHFVGNLHLSPMTNTDESFSKLLKALNKFIIEKRSTSKLLPVKTYLKTLLMELCEITEFLMEALTTHVRQLNEELKDSLPSYEELLNSDSILRKEINDIIDEHVSKSFDNAYKRLNSIEDLITDSLSEISWNGCLSLFSYFTSFQNILQQKISTIIDATTSETMALLNNVKPLLQSRAFSLVPSLVSVFERDIDHIKYSSTFDLVQTKSLPRFKCSWIGLFSHINPFHHVISAFQNTHLITTIIGITSFPFLRRFLHDKYIGASCILASFAIFGYNYLSNFESLARSYIRDVAHRTYLESGWILNASLQLQTSTRIILWDFSSKIFTSFNTLLTHQRLEWEDKNKTKKQLENILLRLREHYRKAKAINLDLERIEV